MSLIVDLRMVPRPREAGDDPEHLTLAMAVDAARRPAALVRLLRERRHDEVRVVCDDVPLSTAQAGMLVLSTLARARVWRVVRERRSRRFSRVSLLAYALGDAIRAIAYEVPHSALLLRSVRRLTARDPGLSRSVPAAGTVTYLRTEPTISYMGHYVGGAATHTTGVIRGFLANSVRVHVFASDRPEGSEDAGFTAVPLRRVLHLVPWLTVTAYGKQIVGAAGQTSPDFVYQRYALGSDAGVAVAAKLGVPLVLEFNGSELWADKNWGTNRMRSGELLQDLESWNVAAASLIVVVSDVIREQLVDDGIEPERVLVNPNGVDVDRVAHLREGTPAGRRAALGLEEAPTVGFIGTFGLWHGVKLLPELVEAVAASAPDARWVLIGDGPLHAEVVEGLEAGGLRDRAVITGIVPHERALELLAACDVCVSPHVPNPDGSRFFGSPTKLFEYMGLGKPIVASDLEQIGEVIEHERDGLLCPPGDVPAAAAAVVRLIVDDELAARLGRAALEKAGTTYSWEAHVARILDRLAR